MKIKTSLFYSLAAATLLGGYANAQSSATDPVGFHTLNVFGATVDGPRFSLVSAGLINPIEYASAATAIDASTVTVDGTPFAGLDYGIVPEVTGGGPGVDEAEYTAYYVEVTDGDEAGAWANIVSNTDNALTVDRDLSAAGGTAKIAIRKHVSINDVFGEMNEAGLDGDDLGEIANADEVSLFADGVSQVFFYVSAAGLEGWYDGALLRNGNTAVEPQQAIYVQRKVAGDVSFTRAGHVKVGPTKLNVNSGFNALANPRAVGIDDTLAPVFTLATSNLYDVADTVNSVDASGDPGEVGGVDEADEITILEDDGTFSVYFRVILAGFEGWYDPSLAVIQDDVVLDNGKGFLLNRKPDLTGTPFVWTVPAEDIAAP
jgi:uncharacterized protein (TIGR02597 family)